MAQLQAVGRWKSSQTVARYVGAQFPHLLGPVQPVAVQGPTQLSTTSSSCSQMRDTWLLEMRRPACRSSSGWKLGKAKRLLAAPPWFQPDGPSRSYDHLCHHSGRCLSDGPRSVPQSSGRSGGQRFANRLTLTPPPGTLLRSKLAYAYRVLALSHLRASNGPPEKDYSQEHFNWPARRMRTARS